MAAQNKKDALTRTYEFKDFVSAMSFVNRVAEIAEKHEHHPDIDIRWNKVMFSFTTHDAGGVTEKDVMLAGLCDELFAQQ